MKGLHQDLSHRCMHTCCYQSSGLPHSHLLRKTRATQNTAQQCWYNLGAHLVPHAPDTIRTRLKAFAQPHHWHTGLHPRGNIREYLPQCAHGRCNDDQVHVLQPSAKGRCSDREAIAERAVGQVACVHPIRLQGLGLRSITRPQANSVLTPRMGGECCAPSART